MTILNQPDLGDAAHANITLATKVYDGMTQRGDVPMAEANAHFAHIQAVSTIALAQAVLHLADVLKETAA